MVVLIVKLRESVRGVKDDVEHVSSVGEKNRDVDDGVSVMLCSAVLCCAELSGVLSCCDAELSSSELSC
jgi:hypothetical protein